jgi:hypothetical protein
MVDEGGGHHTNGYIAADDNHVGAWRPSGVFTVALAWTWPLRRKATACVCHALAAHSCVAKWCLHSGAGVESRGHCGKLVWVRGQVGLHGRRGHGSS